MMGTVVLLKNNEMTVIEDICEADFLDMKHGLSNDDTAYISWYEDYDTAYGY
ncbi:hypothetical protein ACVNSY_07140 [Bacillus sp. OHL2]|uniref:Uncharacterized protein n=2 Tax=Bacillus safensis TaxID=561879 RepID=A0A498TRR0_BACIA|nr:MULTISPECIES: hypothetical protein [Bacillus]MDH6562785.1 hypothetical protein [Bacillus sp. TBS-096]TDU16241.1 hypothetical protein EV579_0491 [Bacillus sp. BK450]QEK62018.1 hypothetical protein FX981_00182 [Bacillus safensis]RKE76390.1 hypothetical protein DFO75_0640 [Bacillus safensis]UDB50938.1 hypothetical protein BWL10_16745 [Bacillus safensis]